MGGGTWRAAGPFPGELGAVGTVRVRPAQWTLGSGWGMGVPISLRTVCLPGPGPWRLGGRACPEQWPESGWPAVWGRGRVAGTGLLLCGAMTPLCSGSFPDVATCPGSLDCALKRRARCPPGAHVCGPCLQPFKEDAQGLCVPRTRQPPGMGEQGSRPPFPTLRHSPPVLGPQVL